LFDRIRARQFSEHWAGAYPDFQSIKEVAHFYADYFFSTPISYQVPSQWKEAVLRFLSAAGHAPLFLLGVGLVLIIAIVGPEVWVRLA
jgi:hypothetical protein